MVLEFPVLADYAVIFVDGKKMCIRDSSTDADADHTKQPYLRYSFKSDATSVKTAKDTGADSHLSLIHI